MSIQIYDNSRNCYVCRVLKAQKDNKIVKKGESYIWVKHTSFSPKEYFRNDKELEEKYPKYYRFTKKEISIIMKKKPSNLTIDKYLNLILL